MIDRKEIDRAIDELESKETTFSSCAKLADLYIIRDRISETPRRTEAYSYDAGPVSSGSDFMAAASGKDYDKLLIVMDELMDTLSVANPRVYASVMRKIAAI